MIVSDSMGFTFFHNPKCAGTTVRSSLYQFDTRDNFFWMFDEYMGRRIDKAHLPLDILRLVYPEDFSVITSYFTFGFVRNPYARVLSAYNEINKNVYKALCDGLISIDVFRQGFLEYVHAMDDSKLDGWNLRYRHCVKQKNLFYLGNKLHADLIVKLESITEVRSKLDILFPSLASVSEQWSGGRRIQNRKPMEAGVRELLDAKGLKILNEVYAEDFEIFNYERVGA